MILTIGFEKCIFGFNQTDWERIVRPELEKPLFSDPEGRKLRRKMCVSAMMINLDAHDRFVVPQQMVDYADIKNNLILIGAGDHFEIWSKANWDKYSHDNLS